MVKMDCFDSIGQKRSGISYVPKGVRMKKVSYAGPISTELIGSRRYVEGTEVTTVLRGGVLMYKLD